MTADRLPPLPDEALTPAQRDAVAAIVAGPRGALYGPFVPLLRSPELMQRVQQVGEYLRYRSAIGERLSELAILIVARHWRQPVEWAIHAPLATRVGLSSELVESIRAGARPTCMTDDEACVHAFCTQLQDARQVDDATFERARSRLGEQGVVDLLGLCGYYTLLAMIMNGACTSVPTAAPPDPFA